MFNSLFYFSTIYTIILAAAMPVNPNFSTMYYNTATELSVLKPTSTSSSGNKKVSLSSRIVGGSAASARTWMASLGYYTANHSVYKHYCGASFVTAQWLLTAAHCVDKHYIMKDKIHVGGAEIFNLTSFKEFSIAQAVVHPEFKQLYNKNDIALLKINSTYAGPYIKLNSVLPPVGTLLSVIGWGYRQADLMIVSPVLHQIQIPSVSTQTCAASYPNNSIDSTQICAGFSSGGKDSCQGDSGGPLYSGHGNNTELVGIISYGNGCALENYYGVNTRVSAFIPWILATINDTIHLIDKMFFNPDVRADGRCGGMWFTKSGKRAGCRVGQCCSPLGSCGSTSHYCGTSTKLNQFSTIN